MTTNKKFCKIGNHQYVYFEYVIRRVGAFDKKEYLRVCRDCGEKEWNTLRK